MAVSKRLRYEILRRDNHACRYCGATAPHVTLTVDHVVPVALGGTDDPTNLVAACSDCNSGKSSTPPGAALVRDVSADAVRWANAMKRAAHLAMLDREKRDEALADFDEAWTRYKVTDTGSVVPRQHDWMASVEQFYAAGLDFEELFDAIEITMRKSMALEDRWRYFCGVAWRKIKAQQETAQRLIDQGFA